MKLNKVLDELTTIMSDIIKEHKEKAISKESLSQITYSQFILIHHIKDTDDPTITKLAELMQISKPSLTSAVNKLMDIGIIHKIPSEDDKRVIYIELTDKGRSISEAEMNAFDECIDRMRAKLGSDFDSFEEMLRRLLE